MEDALQEMKTAMNNRNMWDIMSILERYPQIIYERYPSSDGSNHIVFNRLIALGLEDGVSESLKGMVSSDLITMCTKSNGYNPFHYAVEAMRWRSMITILTDFTYEDIDIYTNYSVGLVTELHPLNYYVKTIDFTNNGR